VRAGFNCLADDDMTTALTTGGGASTTIKAKPKTKAKAKAKPIPQNAPEAEEIEAAPIAVGETVPPESKETGLDQRLAE
jgi:hypothetical protein